MRSARHKILVTVALMMLALVAFWVALSSNSAQPQVQVGFTTAQGHFSNLFAENIFVAWVTNTGKSCITIDDPCTRFENTAGEIITDLAVSWNGEAYSAKLSPGGVAWLANGFDRDQKRFNVVFEYQRWGGPFLKIMSKAIAVLPVNRLPRRMYEWLRRNGLIDGSLHVPYDGAWMAYPPVGKNGSKKFDSETNSTSSAATGSRQKKMP